VAELNVGFWNVQNLFDLPIAKKLKRGPQSKASQEAKLDRLASVIGGFFGGRGPDLLGLAEIGTRSLFDDLIDRIAAPYAPALRLWEGAVMVEHTGLGVVGRDDRIANLKLLDVWRPTAAARPRALLIECLLRSVARPVWIAINHWKSRMIKGKQRGTADWQDRLDAADWLGQRLGLASNMQCVIAMGDFNCEPTEKPFNTLQMRGTRHPSTAISSAKAATTMYNSAWRYLSEPDPWQHPRPSGYRASRPRTTWAGGSVIFDQLLVSKDALLGLPLALRESSINYIPDLRIFCYNRNGYIKPLPWSKAENGQFIGASDHLPLLATFDVV
jgi:endonuclease/exonuclease/phosphatase family metal-dependent hydrolase